MTTGTGDPGPVVHVVDDDASFLTSVCRFFRASGYAVKAFVSARDLLGHLGPQSRGCVVADLHMPELDGLGLQEALHAAGLAIPVVFLTGAGDVSSAVGAMRGGAEDFLSKTAPQAQLLDAVRRAVDRDARTRSEADRLRLLREPFARLTPREREVLSHVLKGEPNKQIGRDLGIDERSVKRHRTNLMAKLNVGSVAELTHLVHAAGLQDADAGEPLGGPHLPHLSP